MKIGKICAIIPVRKGSVRVKNKSIRDFGDTNLLENKIKQLLRLNKFDYIIVNTDSDIAINIANKYNIQTINREEYYVSSECNNSDFFCNLAETSPIDAKYLVYLPVTSPFIKDKTIINMIEYFINNEYDSVVGGELIKHHLWMNNKPLNYDPKNAPNTQDLPDVIGCNYACAIISKEDQIKYKSLVGKKPYFYILSQLECIDIDTIFDFKNAELLYLNKNIIDNKI